MTTTPASTSADLSTTTLPRLGATRYIASVIVGTLIVASLIAAALVVANQPTWWRGFIAAGIAACASLLVSFVVVLPLFERETMTLAYGFIAAGMIRAIAFGAILIIAIKMGGYPQDATVCIGGILYAAIVITEGLVLWMLTHTNHASQSLPTQDRA